MRPAEAIKEVQIEIEEDVRETEQKAMARLARGSNALRNAELTVLSGNQSPSPPGSPPGRRSGFLRTAWTTYYGGGGASGIFGIISAAPYAGYLEEGTSKMAPRPFVDKITDTAIPEIERIFGELG